MMKFEDLYFLTKNKGWNPTILSNNKNITLNILNDLIERFPENINWYSVSLNLDWKDIENNLSNQRYKWKITSLCYNPTFCKLSIIRKMLSFFNDSCWEALSETCDWNDIYSTLNDLEFHWKEEYFIYNPSLPEEVFIPLLLEKRIPIDISRRKISLYLLRNEELRNFYDWNSLTIKINYEIIKNNPDLPWTSEIYLNNTFKGNDPHFSLMNGNFSYEDIINFPNKESLIHNEILHSNLSGEMIDRIIKDKLFTLNWDYLSQKVTPRYVFKNINNYHWNFETLSYTSFTDNYKLSLIIAIQRKYRAIRKERRSKMINIIKQTFVDWYYRPYGKYSYYLYRIDN